MPPSPEERNFLKSDAGKEELAILSVIYKTREEFQEVFARELLSGAVFIPTLDQLSAGQRARITIDLLFCAVRLALDGEVVASLPAPIASAGAARTRTIQATD